MTVTCLCGAVRITVDRPAFVHECNCRLCRSSGARWAYYEPAAAAVEGHTDGYVRADKPDAGAQIRFCPDCGTTTHFTLTPETIARHGNGVVGVNMRLAADAELAGVELRFPDGAAWSGEGAFGYVRPPVVIAA